MQRRNNPSGGGSASAVPLHHPAPQVRVDEARQQKAIWTVGVCVLYGKADSMHYHYCSTLLILEISILRLHLVLNPCRRLPHLNQLE